MPLPDANKKSPRVYPLLQNTDLENLAYATLQSTGQPVAIEEMNEDELRRLVLVNLARLSVKGEWNGLLTTGGGGGGGNFSDNIGQLLQDAYSTAGAQDWVNLASIAPFGVSNDSNAILIAEQPSFVAFISPNTGTLSKIQIYQSTVSGAGNELQIRFYESDDTTYLPTTSIGTEVIVPIGTGDPTGTLEITPTADIELTRGSLYYIGYVQTVTGSVSSRGVMAGYSPSLGPTQSVTAAQGNLMRYVSGVSDNALPSTASTDIEEYSFSEKYRLSVGVQF